MAKHHWMIENADELRTQAVQRRNRGLHTGASAKGWDWQRPLDADEFVARAQVAREQLKLDIQNAWNSYRSACLNIRHGEEFADVPF